MDHQIPGGAHHGAVNEDHSVFVITAPCLTYTNVCSY
jgi:hypothetical protein